MIRLVNGFLSAALALQVGAPPAAAGTPDELVTLFQKTCLTGFPDFTAIHDTSRKLGFERLSETQSAADGTRINVVTYTYKAKKHCSVNARGLDAAAVAKAFTQAMSRQGATNIKIKSNGRIGAATLNINGRKAIALSQPNLATTRISGAKITLKQ